MNPTQLPTDGTLPLLVLQIIAVSGEFPAAFSGHFPGGCSYIESVIGKLKKDGLLRSYTKNGLRGLRLTTSAKRLLLQKYPFDLAPYLTGTSETNSLKSEPERRLRLHRWPRRFRSCTTRKSRRCRGKSRPYRTGAQIPHFRSTIPPASSKLSAVFAPKSAIPA